MDLGGEMLRAYMQDDITVLYNEGFEWGEPKPTTDVEMKAYVILKIHLTKDLAGEEVVSRGIVYVMPTTVIEHDDFIIYNTVRYAILNISPGKDFSENHQEIHLN